VSDSGVENVNGHGRAFFGARPAAGAQIFVHVAGFPLYADFEIARFTADSLDFAVGEKIYFGMPTDIQQLRRENSDSAIIGGERLVELGHSTANAREPFHHMHLDSHFRQVQGGLNSGDSAADNQYVFIHDSPRLAGYARGVAILSVIRVVRSFISSFISRFSSAQLR
jgi:hypothetical protein